MGYNTAAGMTAGMTSSAYSYGSAVLDPLLQASSLASAASAQSSSGAVSYYPENIQILVYNINNQNVIIKAMWYWPWLAEQACVYL